MRQRKIKNVEEKLEQYKEAIINNPKELKGKWKEKFLNNNGVYLEIGCGKGQFITRKAMENPNKNYLAVEGQVSVVVRAAQKIEDNQLSNVFLIDEYIDNIEDYFEENELEGIYLNFSDPWPKKRHSKRRLTHGRFLESYKKIVKDKGFLEFKTDNDDLFDFTIEEIEKLGYKIEKIIRDLHSMDDIKDNTLTEYEEKFLLKEKKINFVKVEL